MPTKLKIKMGHVEFEYEGDAPYDTDAVKDLFTHIESLMGAAPAGAFDVATPQPNDAAPVANGSLTSLAVGTVAARLKAKTGPDLVLAAAAHLQLCSDHESFSRKTLLANMQSAKAHYKQSMSGNLGVILGRLVGDGRLNALANDEWSLTADEIDSIRKKLA